MKALLASALTALVLVTAAWASNVTPAQLSALSKRVTKLEHQNRTLLADLDQQASVLNQQTNVVGCLKNGWNAQRTMPYTVAAWGGFNTPSGFLNLFIAPQASDGIVGTSYLVTSPDPANATVC